MNKLKFYFLGLVSFVLIGSGLTALINSAITANDGDVITAQAWNDLISKIQSGGSGGSGAVSGQCQNEGDPSCSLVTESGPASSQLWTCTFGWDSTNKQCKNPNLVIDGNGTSGSPFKSSLSFPYTTCSAIANNASKSGAWFDSTNNRFKDGYYIIDGYPTWNPEDIGSIVTLSNENRTLNHTNYNGSNARANTAVNSGKYYWEYVVDASNTSARSNFGVANLSQSIGTYIYTDFGGSGIIFRDASASDNNVYSFQLDFDTGTLKTWVNGSSMGSKNLEQNTVYAPIYGDDNSNGFGTWTINTGQENYTYANLAEGYDNLPATLYCDFQ